MCVTSGVNMSPILPAQHIRRARWSFYEVLKHILVESGRARDCQGQGSSIASLRQVELRKAGTYTRRGIGPVSAFGHCGVWIDSSSSGGGLSLGIAKEVAQVIQSRIWCSRWKLEVEEGKSAGNAGVACLGNRSLLLRQANVGLPLAFPRHQTAREVSRN